MSAFTYAALAAAAEAEDGKPRESLQSPVFYDIRAKEAGMSREEFLKSIELEKTTSTKRRGASTDIGMLGGDSKALNRAFSILVPKATNGLLGG